MKKQRTGNQYLKGTDNKRCKDRTGETHINTQNLLFTITEYFNANNCTIQFEDGTIVNNRTYRFILKGQVSNPNNPSIHGVGFIGEGIFKSTFKFEGVKKSTVHYEKWCSILERGCCEILKKRQPSYKNVTVCEEWHNFQNFAQWFEENYNPETMQGWHIDKDILKKGNRIYSPETCCLVPNDINALFKKAKTNKDNLPTGISRHGNKYLARVGKYGKKVHIGLYNTPEEAFEAYKTEKEKYIKEVADKYKNQITDKVYQALYNYQVEITD
jgi:hypothetical protein